MIKLNPTQLYTQLVHAIKCNVVPMVHGSPGISKSAIAQKVADHYNLFLIDWRGSSADPTDTNGLPFRDEEAGKADYLPFATFPVVGDIVPEGYSGWLLCMEEINSAPRAVMAACYKVLHDRMVGTRHLHEDVRIIALGNLMTDGAIVNPMGTALGSRLVHLVLDVDVEETQQYMISQQYDKRVIGFAHFRSSLLYRFEPKKIEFTFPCIRTWTMVNTLVDGINDVDVIRPLIAGAVSDGVAHEFVAYCKVYHRIPDVAEIERNPSKVTIPGELDVLVALVTAGADRANYDNLGAWVEYVNRLQVEHRIMFIRMLKAKDMGLCMDERTDSLIEPVKEYL